VIARARPQHLEETPGPSQRASSIPVCRNIVAVATSTIATTDHCEEYPSGYSSPTTDLWQASSLPTEPRHRRALLIADLVHHGNSLSTRSPPETRLP
jgi:hypothetical protein